MSRPRQRAETAPAEAAATGLPEWDLGDLYGSPEAPEVEADLRRALSAAEALEGEFKGRLAELDGPALAALIARFEQLEEQLGRVMSYAQLLHAAKTDDPSIGRFFQTVQERVNQIATKLLFVTLELNRIEDPSRSRRRSPSRRHSPTISPGCATCGAFARISSTTRSSGSCTRSRSPGGAPGSGCSTRPWPGCASRLRTRS